MKHCWVPNLKFDLNTKEQDCENHNKHQLS